MKKILFSLALMLLAGGSAFGAPRFKELNNFHGKTTIKIEIPASDRDADGGLSIDNVKLHNNGETLAAKKVDAKWGEKIGENRCKNRCEKIGEKIGEKNCEKSGENTTVILEFKKLTLFAGCTLSFTMNGTPVTINLQRHMSRH